MRERLRRVRAPPARRPDAVDDLRAQHLLPAGRATTIPASYAALKARLEEIERTRGCPATASSTCRRRRRRSRRSSAASARRSWRLPPPRAPRRRAAFTRVIIEKPFGTDLETARALNRDVHEMLRRAADLPHRSLPRQRDGPEHPGLPLRQRDLRAAVEQPLRRPRADHRRRERSASRGAAATSSRRASCATWCRTTCSSS